MRIGELGERARVSTKTIRYYESIGLLEEPERTPSGYRDYGDDALERLRFVRDAQATGLSLAEIASVLELKGAGQRSCAHTTQLLERHLVDLDRQIEQLVAARGTRSSSWPIGPARSIRAPAPTPTAARSSLRSMANRLGDLGHRLTFQPTGSPRLEGWPPRPVPTRALTPGRTARTWPSRA